MRLIGILNNEKEARIFYSFLLKEGIKNTYELFYDAATKKEEVRIWVYDEDDLDLASGFLEDFKKDPSDPKFQEIPLKIVPPPPPVDTEKEDLRKTERGQFFQSKPPKRIFLPITMGIILLCSFLYILMVFQQIPEIEDDGVTGMKLGMTPIQQKLLFDYPQSNQEIDRILSEYSFKNYQDFDQIPREQKALLLQAEKIPTWKGIGTYLIDPPQGGWKTIKEIPRFEKIREGEIWRLITPVFLHGGLLHILFNMAWVWILCKQIEIRLNRFKFILLMLIIGIISNVAQYLVGGPYFVGFSGIVVGLVGFIWMRQRAAPWEGYPLERATIIFILIYIGAMLGLEIVSLLLKLFSLNLSANIANTAHIVGGLVGMALGKLSFFSRGTKG